MYIKKHLNKNQTEFKDSIEMDNINREKIEDINRELQSLEGISSTVEEEVVAVNATGGKLSAIKVKIVDFCKNTKKEYLLAIVIFFVVLIAMCVAKPSFVRRPGTPGFCFGMACIISLIAALLVILIPIIARSVKK